MRSVCQTLRVVTDREMEDEAVLEMNELNSFTPHGKDKVELSFGGNSADRRGEASWTSLAGTSQQESELAALRMHGMFSPGGRVHLYLVFRQLLKVARQKGVQRPRRPLVCRFFGSTSLVA
uniref:Uncharacterized protein n=1 Tax=Zea mays TaxID=4577 RepID=A0A804MKD4_MAIZE